MNRSRKSGLPFQKDVGSPALQSAFGRNSEVLHGGVAFVLERLGDHEEARRRASEISGGLNSAARTALLKLAARLGLPREIVEPEGFLFALRTYYALVVKWVTRSILVADGQTCQPSFLCREEHDRMEKGDWAAEAGVNQFPDSPDWAWYLDVWDDRFEAWARSFSGALPDAVELIEDADPARGDDLFGAFYQSLFPKQVRHALGEHYTPGWLAEHVLDRVGFDGASDGRLLDPTCGSGVFLLRALRRLREAGTSARPDRDPAVRIAGMDVNPLAVLTARANYLLAIRDDLAPDRPAELPIHLGDVVLDTPPAEAFDFLVGNPPWLVWDHLPEEYRERTSPLWRRYGLFSLSGSEARHGGGKKDLAMLVVYAGAERYLRDGGRLGMVVTQTLFQTRGAGDGFRRFRLGEGSHLRVLRVDDFVRVQPFETASNWTATIALQKGRPTAYPVPYVRWERRNLDGPPRSAGGTEFECQEFEALPIDGERRQSPWLIRPSDLTVDIAQLTGPSDYEAHLGANTGGANGVYWLRMLGRRGGCLDVENLPARGKQSVPAVRAELEPDLLFPLVRWSDIGRFHAVPSATILLAQDPGTRRGIEESTLLRELPKTHAYLKGFERLLRGRVAYRRYQERAAFYSMYNVGPYTVAPFKVVWRRMDRIVRAAVLEPVDDPLLGTRPVVCQETCAMIAVESAEEAHYLAALLNSTVLAFLVQAHNVRGGKGFGSPGMLEHLRIRRFNQDDRDHRELARLSGEAHRAKAMGQDSGGIQRTIDLVAARQYGLSEGEASSLRPLVEHADG